MSDYGKRISSDEQFSNLAVYEEGGSRGDVNNIVFEHLEWGPNHEWKWMFLGSMFLFIFGWVAVKDLSYWLPWAGEWTWLGYIIGFIVLWAVVWRKWHKPVLVSRLIEMNFSGDKLKVYDVKKGEVLSEWPLDRLHNITVDEHPLAAQKAIERQSSKNPRDLSEEEKSHVLTGRFGEGGGEAAVLLHRAEWPCENSLLEVRQAMVWALKRHNEGGRGQEEKKERGMRPPLN